MSQSIERLVHTHYHHLRVGLRGTQAVFMFIAMLTASATTGVSAGDFALLLSYTVWIYASVWAYVAAVKKTKLLEYAHQMAVDAALFVCLLAGGIALATSAWSTVCSNEVVKTAFHCGSYVACVVFLFFGMLVQLVVLVVVYFGRTREVNNNAATVPMDPASVGTPRGEGPGDYDYEPPQTTPASCAL
ncbi:Aste57867_5233 [Aphanomyces stellatus]|uniref:Aste57867_5233 protein n=1 Tax=Aphanomyces stellatus TaxID=120398 RepID=A0A485KGJ1_9STRA|nr:hypothetical protein As57867_005220 [Aphanomyces stellatus]VFT82306.1 Aste57867_5233 [Aphanomyces stellatus]